MTNNANEQDELKVTDLSSVKSMNKIIISDFTLVLDSISEVPTK